MQIKFFFTVILLNTKISIVPRWNYQVIICRSNFNLYEKKRSYFREASQDFHPRRPSLNSIFPQRFDTYLHKKLAFSKRFFQIVSRLRKKIKNLIKCILWHCENFFPNIRQFWSFLIFIGQFWSFLIFIYFLLVWTVLRYKITSVDSLNFLHFIKVQIIHIPLVSHYLSFAKPIYFFQLRNFCFLNLTHFEFFHSLLYYFVIFKII